MKLSCIFKVTVCIRKILFKYNKAQNKTDSQMSLNDLEAKLNFIMETNFKDKEAKGD
jgi:hypothetical protein